MVDPFDAGERGIVRVGQQPDARQPAIVWHRYAVTCGACRIVAIYEIAGDVYGALDADGWEPSGGWDRDAEPLGDGMRCPACARELARA